LCDFFSRGSATNVATMTDLIPTYVRLPESLKDRLDRAAATNRRSRNKEVVARLSESFEPSIQSLATVDSGLLIGELLRRYQPDEILIRIGKAT
jgi:predicted transcriptional regulator